MTIPAVADRYSRQTRFPGIGPDGQARLAAASVLVLGCGALGSAAAEMLVRAGVGRVRLVDRDVVEPSNLQRQSLFTEADAAQARPKAEAAAEHLAAINSGVAIEAVSKDFSARTAASLLDGMSLVVDGTDNFAARFVLNDAAFRAGLPWVYGACVGSSGVVGVFVPPGPCLRCFLEEPPPAGSLPTCETAGILPSLPALVASLEVGEAIKILVGRGEKLRGLLTLETWDRVEARPMFEASGPRPGCATCGTAEFPSLAGADDLEAISLCGRDAVQVVPRGEKPVDLAEVAARLGAVAEVRRSATSVSATIESVAITVFPDGRCLLRGISEPARARAFHAKYLGG